MPRGNKSGPSNEGPTTGRGLGYCTGNESPGFLNSDSNRGGRYRGQFHGGRSGGRGRRLGFRRGFGHFNQGGDQNLSEKVVLENEIRILKDQLSTLEDHLSSLVGK